MTIRRYWLPILLVGLGLLMLIYYFMSQSPGAADNGFEATPVAAAPSATPSPVNTSTPTSSATASYTPLPILPTRTPTLPPGTATAEMALATDSPTMTVMPAAPSTTAEAAPTSESTPAAVVTPTPGLAITGTSVPSVTGTVAAEEPQPTATSLIISGGWLEPRQRIGVAGGFGQVAPALEAGLPIYRFLNWRIASGNLPAGIIYWPMLRFDENGLLDEMSWEEVEDIIAARPGTIWLVGNEPDVKWQDGVTPEQYARHYHQAYHFIKDRDAAARVAIAGVSQATPLRMRYLDIVLDTYQSEFGEPMPIEVWNVHAFVLREELNSWGVDIPPGMDSAGAMLYEVSDHGSLEIFKQNIIDFRAWMATRGYQNTPLVVSEYGILMPADFGFGSEVVSDYMLETFDFFLTAANSTGYPADGGRLVQWWYWYNLYDPVDFPSGNLYDASRGTLTPVGEAFRDYVNNLP
jgi:hypothetical protein